MDILNKDSVYYIITIMINIKVILIKIYNMDLEKFYTLMVIITKENSIRVKYRAKEPLFVKISNI